MSRIGKMPIAIPDGVEISVGANNEVKVKGPKGELSQKVDSDMIVKIQDNEAIVDRPTEQKRHKAMHGLYRSLIANMVEGVTNGFKITQEIVGVGYKVSVQGQVVELSLGYSHDILFKLPTEIKATATTEKGKNPKIILEGIDKQLVGQIAHKIRSFRKPEPYKGKGIRFENEQIRRKAGKTAGK